MLFIAVDRCRRVEITVSSEEHTKTIIIFIAAPATQETDTARGVVRCTLWANMIPGMAEDVSLSPLTDSNFDFEIP